MTQQEKDQILRLRNAGKSYGEIAATTGQTKSCVKSFCIRAMPKRVAGSSDHCEQCGCPITQNPKRKQKRFCSEACRRAWWSAHRESGSMRSAMEYKCASCGKPFRTYAATERKYCCTACYMQARFGGKPHEQ